MKSALVWRQRSEKKETAFIYTPSSFERSAGGNFEPGSRGLESCGPRIEISRFIVARPSSIAAWSWAPFFVAYMQYWG